MRPLDRFREAQDQARAGFDAALAEMRSGRKRGHWIWYVFPQLSGLGSSYASQMYGLADVSEAVDYSQDPVLRGRLLAMTNAVAEQLRGGADLRRLMGADIDARKLVSSLTLFGYVSARLAEHATPDCRELSDAAEEVLTAADAQGYPRCAYTLERLRSWQRQAGSTDRGP